LQSQLLWIYFNIKFTYHYRLMNKDNIKKSAIYEYISKETGQSTNTIKTMFSRYKWDVLDSKCVSDYINRKKFKYQYKWCWIYSIINKVNKREYIWQTNSLSNRSATHITNLMQNKHHNKELQSDFNKYWANNFEFYVLIKTDKDDKEWLLILERQEIIKRKNTYNLTDTNNIITFTWICIKHKDIIREFLIEKWILLENHMINENYNKIECEVKS
jgi:hypothetical protein